MKKLETLLKNFESLNNETIDGIVSNENIDVSTLTDNEKLSVMIFSELEKSLKTRDRTLVMDCNYAKSKMHSKKDPADNRWLVDYYRLISNTNNESMVQIYVSASVRRGTCKFRVCTSCAKSNLDAFAAAYEELKFKPVIDRKTGNAKTTERKGIPYEDIVKVIKDVCTILSGTCIAQDTDMEDGE